MRREELLIKVHSMKNDDVIELGNGYSVMKSFDKCYFKCEGKIFMELNQLSTQLIYYPKWLKQFIDYIMQHIEVTK